MKISSKWVKWCKQNGLRPHANNKSRSNRNRRSWLYLKGKGYVWRVTCDNMFQRGDNHDDFDRWARCTIDETPLPKNAKQFADSVAWMLHCANSC